MWYDVVSLKILVNSDENFLHFANLYFRSNCLLNLENIPIASKIISIVSSSHDTMDTVRVKMSRLIVKIYRAIYDLDIARDD